MEMEDAIDSGLKRPTIEVESEPKRLNKSTPPPELTHSPTGTSNGANDIRAPISNGTKNGKQPIESEETAANDTSDAEPSVKTESILAKAAEVPQEERDQPASPELKKEVDEEQITAEQTEPVETEHETDNLKEVNDEESETEQEDDGDEENISRTEAIAALTDIEIEFAALRHHLHADQMAKFDFELALCLEGAHPELELIEEKIRERKEYQIRKNQAWLDNQLQCIANTTRAVRDHLHQQFCKDSHDIRTELLRETTREWYQVNDERRAADKLVPDFEYRPDATTTIASELPQLIALSKYRGIPAAPSISGISATELSSDLRALGLKKS